MPVPLIFEIVASRRMLPHTATVFVNTGRNARYETEYSAYVLNHVYCKGGQSYQGGTPSDPLTVYMFDLTTKGIGTLVLKGDGNQYIVPYDASSSAKPPKDARIIRAVERRKAGSPRMWHWKVVAE